MRLIGAGFRMVVLASLATLLVAPATRSAQGPSLSTVLSRATHYVDELYERLANVAMEERYEQRAWRPGPDGLALTRTDAVTLRSDYLLVQPGRDGRHFGFRDVFEANGRAVRDRDERLTELFLDPAASRDRQILDIVADSARYNVGDIERNINTPTMALRFLGSAYRPRFEFERATETSARLGVDEPDPAAGAWVIGYSETGPTTVIRGRDDENLRVRGRYWIEPLTGRVLISELVLDEDDFDVLIIVRYAPNESLGHSVPVEMRERYYNRRTGSRVDGTAAYARFRRFQVVVNESAPSRN